MPIPSVDKRCPFCGEWTPAAMVRCRACGETADSRRSDSVGAVDFLIPQNVSPWSMLACYLGLLGCFLPILGIALGALAILFGVIALRRRRKSSTYGSVTSNVRAVLGLIFGAFSILLWSAVVIWLNGGFRT